MVNSYLIELKLQYFYISGKPTYKWYFSFLNRHQDFYSELLTIVEENSFTTEDIYNEKV